MRKTGILLLNVGSPESEGVASDGRVLPPGVPQVREYLREFLMDPRVIDMPFLLRWVLVNGIILKTRPAASCELYRRVWTNEGSPLLVHTRNFAERLRARIGWEYPVAVAMRYGNPGIPAALRELKESGVTELSILPLYPQYADATTGSAMDASRKAIAQLGWSVPIKEIRPFYRDAGFLGAFAHNIQRERTVDWDAILFSFHGLPESQILKAAKGRLHCLKDECCSRVADQNADCYRAQCFETARLLANECGIPEGSWRVGFQSRLGRARWITPSTESLLRELAGRGKKHVLVACPSFVADCLETLEEIGMRAREWFIAAGGETLQLVPSLNASAHWVDAVASWVQIAPSAASKGETPERVVEEVT